jgi:hypothetical protein
MSEFGPQEGCELTLSEWKAAIAATGWTVGFVSFPAGDAVGIKVKLNPPTNKRQSSVPAVLNNQLKRLMPLLMAETFGERDEEGFRHCPQCCGTYSAKLWQDVAAMCGNNLCPLRSVK